MRLSWALVHSKRPEDVQRGIAMLEGDQNGETLPRLSSISFFKCHLHFSVNSFTTYFCSSYLMFSMTLFVVIFSLLDLSVAVF